MQKYTWLGLGLSLFLSIGCAKQESAPAAVVGPQTKKEEKIARESKSFEPRDYLSYASFEGRAKTQKNYILIAGGRDDANFAQEIIEQKRLLISLGVPEWEIACFYTIPNSFKFSYDREQYISLANELKSCYPAYPKYVWRLLEESTSGASPTYIYVTSHGLLPLSEGLKKWKLPEHRAKEVNEWITSFPAVDQFIVMLDAFKEDGQLDLDDRIEKLRQGVDPRDIYFTPRYLKEVLRKKEPRSSPLNVVVQACYSGGFADSYNPTFKPDTLRGLDKLTLLTAARPDRSSFGCGSGNFRTFFGGAFNDELIARGKLPQELDWKAVHDAVFSRVNELEKEFVLREKPKHFEPSEPMFYQR